MTKIHRKKLHKVAWNREMLRNTSIIFIAHIAHIARTINFHRAFFSTKFIWVFYNLIFLLLLFSHHRFSFSQWDVFQFHNDVLFKIEEKNNLIAKTIMFASKLSKYEDVIYIMLEKFSKKFNDKCNAARRKHNLIIIRKSFVVKKTISLLRE
jgi:hypothetical protein